MTSPDRWISVSTAYITPRPDGAGDAWQEQAAGHGGRGTHRVREVAEVRPETDVAAALGLQPGQSAIVRRRLVFFDDRPVELADSYYPLAIAASTPLAEPGKIQGGAVTLLAHLGHQIRRVREDVSVRMPTEEERRLLQLGDNHPVMVILRTAMAADSHPVEVMTMVVADGRQIRYELAR